MKINVDLTQPSTQRGLIWAIGAIMIFICAGFGWETKGVIAFIMTANGAHGFFVDDNQGGDK
jgi:hypothetical protein